MKRNREELPPNTGLLTGAPAAKAQRRVKDSRARKVAAKSLSTQKSRDARGEDERSASVAADASPPLVMAGAVGWDVAAELGWWWCLWGVEEEKLLGWFPFADEDFVCCEESEGGELEEEDQDIWQLQQIHEIPSTSNQ
ncbi:hypothetical protein Cni_G27265 [Canna indica]|uniref:Uncharacterized protein n=1 Tax=Canna indica TaxID=4628 RepID=A0AAQ3L0W1_9LILI|nr:hypothetical protein Cni_G27265 [Canna indica]